MIRSNSRTHDTEGSAALEPSCSAHTRETGIHIGRIAARNRASAENVRETGSDIPAIATNSRETGIYWTEIATYSQEIATNVQEMAKNSGETRNYARRTVARSPETVGNRPFPALLRQIWRGSYFLTEDRAVFGNCTAVVERDVDVRLAAL